MYDHLKIGTIIYAVHNKYVNRESGNGRIQVCRIKTYENKDGKIMPVLTLVGNTKTELITSSHTIYINLADAIDAIRS
jgi:hypothetical protein